MKSQLVAEERGCARHDADFAGDPTRARRSCGDGRRRVHSLGMHRHVASPSDLHLSVVTQADAAGSPWTLAPCASGTARVCTCFHAGLLVQAWVTMGSDAMGAILRP